MVEVVPKEYDNIIQLIAPDGRQFIGLTNRVLITYFDVLDKLFKNAEYRLSSRTGKYVVPAEEHYLRAEGGKDYESDDSYVQFKENKCKLSIVIATGSDKAYPPLVTYDNDLDELYNDIPVGSSQIFIKDLNGKTIVLGNLDLSKMLCGHIYKIASTKTKVPIGAMRLIYKHQLNIESPASLYDIMNGSTIHMCLRLKGGMFHSTSGKNGNYNKNTVVYFSLDN